MKLELMKRIKQLGPHYPINPPATAAVDRIPLSVAAIYSIIYHLFHSPCLSIILSSADILEFVLTAMIS